MLLVIEIQTKKQGLLASSYSAYAIDCKNIRDLPYAEGLGLGVRGLLFSRCNFTHAYAIIQL